MKSKTTIVLALMLVFFLALSIDTYALYSRLNWNDGTTTPKTVVLDKGNEIGFDVLLVATPKPLNVIVSLYDEEQNKVHTLFEGKDIDSYEFRQSFTINPVELNLKSGIYYISLNAEDKKESGYVDLKLIVNKPPKITTSRLSNAKEGSVYIEEISSEDADDGNLVYTLLEAPEGVEIYSDGKTGIIFAPFAFGFESAGTYGVKVRVSDNRGGEDTKSYGLVVEDVNRQPQVEKIQDINVREGEKIVIVVDAFDPDGDELKFEINSIHFLKQENKFIWATTFFDAGSYKVRISVSDGKDTVSQEVNVNVENVNRVPVIKNIPDIKVKEGEEIVIVVDASDPDGDELKFKIDNTNFLKQENKFIWLTTFFDAGSHKVRLSVTDGKDTAFEDVNINIENVNLKPFIFISLPEEKNVRENEVLTFTVTAVDPDLDEVTLSISNLPENAKFHKENDLLESGTFTWTPNFKQSGTYRVTIKASDGKLENTEEVKINVIDVNRATAEDIFAETEENKPIEIQLEASDPDGDEIISYQLIIDNQFFNGKISDFDSTKGKLKYTPKKDFVGTDQFRYRAIDSKNQFTNIATVTINVSETIVEEPPEPEPPEPRINRRPIISIPDLKIREDIVSVVDISKYVHDPDNDTLSYYIHPLGVPASLSNAQCSIEGTKEGTNLKMIPEKDFNGNAQCVVVVSDGKLKASQYVNIEVTPVDDPTVFHTLEAQTIPVQSPDGTVVYRDVASKCVDVDSETKIEVVTIPPRVYELFMDGRDLKIKNLDPAFSGVTVPRLSCNGIVRAFALTVTPDVAELPAPAPITPPQPPVTPVTPPTPPTPPVTPPTPPAPASNPKPVAGNLAATTNEDTPVNVNLQCTDDDPFTFNIVSTPATGSLSGSGGARTYTPNPDVFGSDLFEYSCTDSEGDTGNTATVTIAINPVNDAPDAVDESVTVPEDATVLIDVLANDNDVEDGKPVLDFITISPLNGVASISANKIKYTPNLDFVGADSLKYRVKDSSGATDTATLFITVTAANDAPAANNINIATNEDTPVSITLDAADVDNDPLTFSIVNAPINGVITNFNPNAGTLTYTPNSNFNGLDSFTFKANDGAADSNTATVSITVNPVNDAPDAADDSVTISEDTTVLIDVLANDNDVEDGKPVLDLITVNPINGVASISGNKIRYTPNMNFVGSDSLKYRVKDSAGLTDTATLTITVTAANDAPTANNINIATNEDNQVSITLEATDADNDPLIFYIVNNPTNGVITNFNPNSGTLTYTPNSNFNGPDSFTFKANDGTADSNTATVSITINSVNDAPDANDDSVAVPEDATVLIDVLANDNDVEDGKPNLDLITVNPASGVALISAGKIQYTPNPDFAGGDSLTYRVKDSAGLTDTATLSITITEVNDAPTANNINVATDEDTPIIISLNADDAENDPLTFSIVNAPINGVITNFNPNAGTLTYTPNNNFNGMDSFTFKANDGTADSNTATVSIAIANVNDGPAITTTPVTQATEGKLYTYDVDASDIDNDPLTFSLVKSPAGMTVDANTGLIKWLPEFKDIGKHNVIVQAADPTGLTARQGFALEVLENAKLKSERIRSAKRDLLMPRIILPNEGFTNGGHLIIHVAFNNRDNVRIKELKVTASLIELGNSASSKKFDIPASAMKTVRLELDTSGAEPGREYMLMLSVSSKGNNIKRVFRAVTI